MKTIHKYPADNVGLSNCFSRELPAGAQILSVAMQGNEPQIWAMVDTDRPTQERAFRWCATGEDLDGGLIGDADKYIGSIQWGRFVFHLFELASQRPD